MSQTLPERRRSSGLGLWEPFDELEQVTDRMRRMLEQTFGAFGFEPGQSPRGWSPLVDLEETDDSYVVEAELPGVTREDVKIELVGNELEIRGECKEREHKGELRRKTRHTDRFEYRVRLPDQVEADKIDAKLADGVLTVRVPKSERSQRQKIEVKS